LQTLAITRVLDGRRRGSSRPVLVETAAGRRLVKLRGAAQGTGPLVAEVIVGALADALGLRVPARALVTLAPGTPTDDRDQELGDLLAASAGENLGLALLEGARDVEARDVDLLARVPAAEAAAILWLDRLTLNLDRTPRNPNLLWWRDAAWLIDHGAALRFHYDWPAVTEDATRAGRALPHPHLFEAAAAAPGWAARDAAFAARLPREALERAVAEVPDSFLAPMLPGEISGRPAEALRRRRAAYVAFLWKRLQSPRAWAEAGGP
jgi:hypothetical protein